MGDLRVNMTGNQSGFQQMLNTARQEVKKFGNDVSDVSIGKRLIQGAGLYLGFDALKGMLDSFISKASGLRELSEQMGIGADETQRWQKAADHLGLSAQGMITVLNGVRDAAVAALTDPKKAELFNRLGIPREDVTAAAHGRNLSEFTRSVLSAGGKDEESRSNLRDIAGARAEKYIPVGDEFKKVTADLDKAALDLAHSAELLEKAAGNSVGSIFSKAIVGLGSLVPGSDANNKLSYALSLRWNALKSGDFKRAFQMHWDAVSDWEGGAGHFGGPKGTSEIDPMPSLIAQKDAERRDRTDEAQRSERDHERELMTIGDRRNSIAQERLRIAQKIKEVEARTPPLTMKSEEEKKDFEAKKLEEIARLRGEDAGYALQLRQKPEQFGVDSLSKSGLYSGAALAFNSDLGIGQKQLQVQQRMEHHLFIIANRPDPHTP